MSESEPSKYYDHEPVYQRIRASGGQGWDDRPGAESDPGSYVGLTAFLQSARCPPAGRALEVGCGGGQAAMLLARAGFAVSAMDFSNTAIELARANASAAGLDILFSVGDAHHLAGYDDDSFQLVLDNHVLHCVVRDEDRAAALAAWYRVLIPGGTLFSETMTSDGDFDGAALGADAAGRTERRMWVAKATLNQELAAAGFRIEHQAARAESPGFGDLLVTVARRPRARP